MALELTPQGLQTDTQADIRDRMIALMRAIFGDDIATDLETNNGQVIFIQSETLAMYQQALLAVFGSYSRSGARGVRLDVLGQLIGSRRRPATPSTAFLDLTFANADTRTVANGASFLHVPTQTTWQVFDSQGSFSSTSTTIRVRALATGPTIALAGSEWVAIDTIPDLETTTQPQDAAAGRDVQTDANYRIQQQREMFASGSGPLAAITGAVSKVETEDGRVIYARTYHNPVQAAHPEGIPFKAFNVVVVTEPPIPPASLRQAIFDAIWSAMGAGGEAWATVDGEHGTVTDSEGSPHDIAFDVVADIDDVTIDVTLVTSTSELAVSPNIEDVVHEAIFTQATQNHEVPGRDVLAWQYVGIVNSLRQRGEVSGVDNVIVTLSSATLGLSDVDKLPIRIRQRAIFQDANIQVEQD